MIAVELGAEGVDDAVAVIAGADQPGVRVVLSHVRASTVHWSAVSRACHPSYAEVGSQSPSATNRSPLVPSSPAASATSMIKGGNRVLDVEGTGETAQLAHAQPPERSTGGGAIDQVSSVSIIRRTNANAEPAAVRSTRPTSRSARREAAAANLQPRVQAAAPQVQGHLAGEATVVASVATSRPRARSQAIGVEAVAVRMSRRASSTAPTGGPAASLASTSRAGSARRPAGCEERIVGERARELEEPTGGVTGRGEAKVLEQVPDAGG